MEVNDKKELTEEERENAYVLWFNQLRRADVALVGGKSSSLGELTSGTDVPVPYGFATTACGLPALHGSQWLEREGKCLAGNFEGPGRLRRSQIRKIMREAPMPEDLAEDIGNSYDELAKMTGQNEPYVAVRSSATAEDLPDASFAGEQDTYLNVRGRKDVIRKVQDCYASLFTDRATYYRIKQKFPQEKVALSAAVQMMAFSKSAGVMFTVNVANGDDTKVMI